MVYSSDDLWKTECYGVHQTVFALLQRDGSPCLLHTACDTGWYCGIMPHSTHTCSMTVILYVSTTILTLYVLGRLGVHVYESTSFKLGQVKYTHIFISVLVYRSHLLGGRLSLCVQSMKTNWRVRSTNYVVSTHHFQYYLWFLWLVVKLKNLTEQTPTCVCTLKALCHI